MLLGEQGIDIHGTTTNNTEACLNIIQLEDGSYVFSYCYMRYGNSLMRVHAVRLSNDGRHLWDTPIDLGDAANLSSYEYNWMVDAGASEFIILYTVGVNKTLTAQKFDFEGKPVWPQPMKVYFEGGFPEGAPLHTFIEFIPDGNYGQHSIQLCADGDIAVFYMKQVGESSVSEVEVYASRIDGNNGTAKWTGKLTTLGDFKAGLQSLPLFNNAYYLTKFNVGLESDTQPVQYYMQPININGALSTDPAEIPSSVPTVVADGSFFASVTADNITFNTDAPIAAKARLAVYSATGQMVNKFDTSLAAGANSVAIANTFTSGVYMAVVSTGTSARSIRFIIEN